MFLIENSEKITMVPFILTVIMSFILGWSINGLIKDIKNEKERKVMVGIIRKYKNKN